MSDAAIVAICTAVPLVIAAIANLFVSLRNSRKADEIHALADGNLSKMNTQLLVANERIEGLRTVVAVQGAVGAQQPSAPAITSIVAAVDKAAEAIDKKGEQ